LTLDTISNHLNTIDFAFHQMPNTRGIQKQKMVSLAQKMLKRSSNTNDNGNDKCIGHNDLVPDKQGYDTNTTNDTISCLPKAY
jgi:hypothetical protein